MPAAGARHMRAYAGAALAAIVLAPVAGTAAFDLPRLSTLQFLALAAIGVVLVALLYRRGRTGR